MQRPATKEKINAMMRNIDTIPDETVLVFSTALIDVLFFKRAHNSM
jgi:hypothetical protein